MRRIGLLTLLAGAALAAAPAPAPAANRCVAQPGVETCSTTLGELVPATKPIVYYATHPDELIICVRECGPPGS
jgi:hypothetical protein